MVWALVGAGLLLALSLTHDTSRDASARDSVRTYESLQALARVAEPGSALLTASEPAMVEPLFTLPGVDSEARREVIYLENFNFGPLKQLARQDFDAPVVKPHRVLQRTNQLLREGRSVYFSLWPPSRVVMPVHHEIHVALRKTFDLEPTGIENIYRVHLRPAEDS